jgi:hypothetical protein
MARLLLGALGISRARTEQMNDRKGFPQQRGERCLKAKAHLCGWLTGLLLRGALSQ